MNGETFWKKVSPNPFKNCLTARLRRADRLIHFVSSFRGLTTETGSGGRSFSLGVHSLHRFVQNSEEAGHVVFIVVKMGADPYAAAPQ